MSFWDKIFFALIDDEFSLGGESQQADFDDGGPLFSEKLRELFLAAANDTSIPDCLRALVERDTWYVAVDETGAWQVTVFGAGAHRMLLEPERAPSGKKKHAARGGKGGRLISAFTCKPDVLAVKVDGRQLVSGIESVDGILIHESGGTPFEVSKEHFAEMGIICAEFRLERVLVYPAEGQLDTLLSSLWWVEVDQHDQPRYESLSDVRGKLVMAHTRKDRRGLSLARRLPMTGAELFEKVAEMPECDGICINCRALLGREDYQINLMLLPLSFIHGVLRGEDDRPGVGMLPARSMKEIDLWLSMRRFPYKNRRMLNTSVEGKRLVRAVVPERTDWVMQETGGGQFSHPDPTWSPVFQLPPVSEEASEESSEEPFGRGPSRIICPGFLARELNASAFGNGQDADRYFRVGKRLIVGRWLDATDIEMAKSRLALANELLKLLPEGADTIPRSAFKTVAGAAFISEHPHGATRDWIEGTVRTAKKYTKTWVWGH